MLAVKIIHIRTFANATGITYEYRNTTGFWNRSAQPNLEILICSEANDSFLHNVEIAPGEGCWRSHSLESIEGAESFDALQ